MRVQKREGERKEDGEGREGGGERYTNRRREAEEEYL